MSENMLEIAKKSLLIPVTENYADEELLVQIASCRQLLITAGVPREIAESSNDSLVSSYYHICEDKLWLQKRWYGERVA